MIFQLELRKCTSRTRRAVHYKVAIVQLELRNCTSRTTLVLQSCDFPAGAAEVYFAYYTCTTKLRFSSWSCGSVLRALHVYYKVAIIQLGQRKCTSRTTLVLQSCDFPAGAAETTSGTTLVLKVAILQLKLRKCTSRTALVLQSCDFQAGASRIALVLQSCDFRAGVRKCTSRTTLVLVAIFQLELRKCTSRTTLVLKSCDLELELRKCISLTTLVLQSCAFPSEAAEMFFTYYACTAKLRFRAGVAEVYFAYYACTTKLRFSSWSCGSILHILDVYYKVAIFQLELRKCTSRTTLVLTSLDSPV